MSKNEVATIETENLTLIDELSKNSKDFYCSMPMNTIEERKIIFNAMGKCDYRLSDCLNTTINLKNVIAQRYESVNEETGEKIEKVRTIFIDENGKTYASASKGLFSSTKKLFALMDFPDKWQTSIPIQVVETQTKQGFKTFEIKLV